MTRQNLAKLALAAAVAIASALPARAAMVTVQQFSGENLSFVATEVGGTIDFTFNSLNFVSTINGLPVLPPISATFPDLFLTTGPVTPNPPPPNVKFTPAFNFTQYAVRDFSQITFDYEIGLGTTLGNILSLDGVVFIDPASVTDMLVANGNTYDFSLFKNPAPFFFTFSASVGNVIATLEAGNGMFSGTASFSQFIQSTPEPSSIVLLGMGGLATVVARRRRKA